MFYCFQECKKLDTNINVLENDKTKLENKLAYLKNSIINIEKGINDILRNIEDIGATKMKVCIFLNICNLLYYMPLSLVILIFVNHKIFVQCI